LLNVLGFDADVIERQLAHQKRNKVRGALSSGAIPAERREMMQACADFIDGLAGMSAASRSVELIASPRPRLLPARRKQQATE
jgi:hypothetical protein